MRYKNTQDVVIKFRAHNTKGVVEEFELKSGQEMESDRECTFIGLKEVSEKAGKGKSIKKEEKLNFDLDNDGDVDADDFSLAAKTLAHARKSKRKAKKGDE